MNTIAIGNKEFGERRNLKTLLFGGNDLEKRDRLLGLSFIIAGLFCLLALPEAEVARQHFTGNSPDTNLIYNALFIGSFLTFIGPCLMLPYRYGALPLVTAVLWSILQVHGAFSTDTGIEASAQLASSIKTERSQPR